MLCSVLRLSLCNLGIETHKSCPVMRLIYLNFYLIRKEFSWIDTKWLWSKIIHCAPMYWEKWQNKEGFLLYKHVEVCGSFLVLTMCLYSWYELLSGCTLDHRKLLLCVWRVMRVWLHPVSHFHSPTFTTKETNDYFWTCNDPKRLPHSLCTAFDQHVSLISPFCLVAVNDGTLYHFYFQLDWCMCIPRILKVINFHISLLGW